MSTFLPAGTGTNSQSHGLPSSPAFAQCVLECTSSDGVFSTGDRVFINPMAGAQNVGFDIRWNASTLFVQGLFNDRTPYGLWIIEHNTGESFVIDATNRSKWNLIVNLFY